MSDRQDPNTTTGIRLQALHNGYTPLPNIDKMCVLSGWPSVEVDEAEIRRWGRMSRFEATGLRLDNGLCAIDFDVNHDVVRYMYSNLLRDFPALGSAIMRMGKGFKEAWFVRTSEPFPRIAGPLLAAPNAAEDDEAHRVEVFGGGSPRQFGALGWHTKGELEYAWDSEADPTNTLLADLPEFTESEISQIVSYTTEWLLARGFTVLSEQGAGRTDPEHVHDLTPDMTFCTREDGDVDLETLRRIVEGNRGGHYYCSASFADGPVARNTRRCSISIDHDGGLSIWDSMSLLTHHEAEHAPLSPEEEDDEAMELSDLLTEQGFPEVQQYLRTETGAIRQNEENMCTRMMEADWAGVFSYSDYDHYGWVMHPIPGDDRGLDHPRRIGDNDFHFTLSAMQRDMFPAATPGKIKTAIAMVSARQTHHAPRDYLDGLVWDGQCRLTTLAETYLGTEVNGDAAYVRAAMRKWMISAVARVMEPGCKADHMLVLQGPQGAGKSTFFNILAGSWFGDDMPSVSSKDAKQWIRDKWIAEIAELSAIRGKDVEHVKAFLTTTTDSFRRAYGAVDESVPRHTVFAGSTNADAFLNDPTGGRRYWPIKIGVIDLTSVQRDRDQLWAEAAQMYRAGEKWHLDKDMDVDAITGALAAQEDAYEVDPDEGRILEWCRWNCSDHATVRGVFEGVFLEEHEKKRKTDGRTSHVIVEALKRGGWVHGSTVRGIRRWVRGPDADPFEVTDLTGLTNAQKATMNVKD